MTIASVPTPECEALICRLLAATPIVVSASQLSDSEADAAIELQEAGHVVVADDLDGEPGIRLSPSAAAKAGVMACPGGLSWQPVPPVLPETAAIIARDAKRKRVRIINETDFKAKAKRGGGKVETPVDRAVAAAVMPFDEGGFQRPAHLLGTGMVWDGPDIGNLAGRPDKACQVCGGAEIARGKGCLKCTRQSGEKPRSVKRAKAKRAG